MNLQLFDIVKQQIPNFDSGSEADLIKAEKILKAYQKTEGTISQNDIDEFIEFYKENGNHFEEFFDDENLQKILKYEYFRIESSKNIIFKFSEEKRASFGEHFEEAISGYLKSGIQKNDWYNLRVFYKQYYSIISFNNLILFQEAITDKNGIVKSILPHYEQYPLLKKEYRFALEKDFYALQSDIDSNYFYDDIFTINNDVADFQKTTDYNKVFLGKILMALKGFDTEEEELKRLLDKNSKIGAKWASKESKMDKLIEKNKIDAEKDHGKTAEWIALSIFYAIIGFAVYKFYGWKPNIALGIFVLEFVVFLIANKKLNQHFEENSESQGDKSFRRKLKKFGFKILILQLYVLVVLLFLGIIGAIIALAVATGFGGIIGLVLIIRLIIRVSKKK